MFSAPSKVFEYMYLVCLTSIDPSDCETLMMTMFLKIVVVVVVVPRPTVFGQSQEE